MKHSPSQEDLDYLEAFKTCVIDASEFHHREHLQIAYTLLTQMDVDDAHSELRKHILGLLNHLGMGTEKYHETMTYAWLLAVKHFMEKSEPSIGFDMFIKRNETLLDTRIMPTHYSHGVISSKEAKESYVQPDLEVIPVYA